MDQGWSEWRQGPYGAYRLRRHDTGLVELQQRQGDGSVATVQLTEAELARVALYALEGPSGVPLTIPRPPNVPEGN